MTTLLPRRRISWRNPINSKKKINVHSSNFFHFIKAVVLVRNLMVFWDLHLRKVLWIEKRITFGLSSIMALFRSQYYHSVWHQVILMISPMPYSEATTLLKLLAARKDCRRLRTTLEIIKHKWGIGPLTSLILVTKASLWRTEMINQSDIQLLLTLEAHLLRFLLQNTYYCNNNGLNKLMILTAKVTQLFAIPSCHAKICLRK